jgi:hypothetical protein
VTWPSNDRANAARSSSGRRANARSATDRSHDGIKQFFRQWLAAFESYHAHAEDFIDAGEAVTDYVMVGRCGSRSTASRKKPSKQ